MRFNGVLAESETIERDHEAIGLFAARGLFCLYLGCRDVELGLGFVLGNMDNRYTI